MAEDKQVDSSGVSTNEKDSHFESVPEALSATKETQRDIDPEIQEFAKTLPPQARQMMAWMLRRERSGPLPHPVFERFTSEHVGNFLDYAHEDGLNAYKLASSNRIYHLIYFFGILGFLVFLFLTIGATDKALLTEIIRLGLIMAGSFAGGYGWRVASEKRRAGH